MEKVEIQRDAQLIVCHVSISGVKRTSTVLADQRIADSRETEARIDTRIENVEQHNAAKEFQNRVRAMIPRFSTQTPLGWLTDSKRLAKMMLEWDSLRDEIRSHNGTLGQCHFVKVEVYAVHIGVALTPDLQRVLCGTVREALQEAVTLIQAQEWTKLSTWLAVRKHCASLMPGIVQSAVQRAVDSIRDARTEGARAEREGRTWTFDPEAVDTALGWVIDPTIEEDASMTH